MQTNLQQRLIWKRLTRDEVRALYQNEMQRDFPPDELRPLRTILAMYDRNCYDPYGVFAYSDTDTDTDKGATHTPKYGKDTLCGYLNVVHPDDYPEQVAFLDYFATTPDLRGNGLGETLLQTLYQMETARGSVGLMWEAETPHFAPDPALAERRMGFYARAGSEPTGLRQCVYGVWFDVLYHPCAGTWNTATAKAAMVHTYHQLMNPTMFAKEFLIEEI